MRDVLTPELDSRWVSLMSERHQLTRATVLPWSTMALRRSWLRFLVNLSKSFLPKSSPVSSKVHNLASASLYKESRFLSARMVLRDPGAEVGMEMTMMEMIIRHPLLFFLSFFLFLLFFLLLFLLCYFFVLFSIRACSYYPSLLLHLFLEIRFDSSCLNRWNKDARLQKKEAWWLKWRFGDLFFYTLWDGLVFVIALLSSFPHFFFFFSFYYSLYCLYGLVLGSFVFVGRGRVYTSAAL